MAGYGETVYNSADFGHKKSEGNENINLEGRKTKMFVFIYGSEQVGVCARGFGILAKHDA